MVIKTASPGIVVNEVDLTRGTSDAITTNIGAFVGPFQRGPVGELVLINTEVEFQRVFGDPTDDNYEYWWTVSNFLEYGGICYVVRADDSVGDSSGQFPQTMRNATDDIITQGDKIERSGGEINDLELLTIGGVPVADFVYGGEVTTLTLPTLPTETRGALAAVSFTDTGATYTADLTDEPVDVTSDNSSATATKLLVTTDNTGAITSVSVDPDNKGTLHEVNDTLTIPAGGNLGGIPTTDDITVNVDGVDVGLYNDPSDANNPDTTVTVAVTTGNGTGLTVDVEIVGGDVQSVSVNNGGSGYTTGDAVDLLTADIGNDLVGVLVGDVSPSPFTPGDGSDPFLFENFTLSGTTNEGVEASIEVNVDQAGVITSSGISQGGKFYLAGDLLTISSTADNTEGTSLTTPSVAGYDLVFQVKAATDIKEEDYVDVYQEVYVKNEDDFFQRWFQSASAPGKFIAQNPGSWGNGLSVAVIDHGADFEIALKSATSTEPNSTAAIFSNVDGSAAPDNTAFGNVTKGKSVGEYIVIEAASGDPALQQTYVPAVGDMVEAWDNANDTAAAGLGKGFIVDKSTEGVYTVLVLEGEFTVSDRLHKVGTSADETTLSSTEIYPLGDHILYARNDDFSVATLWTPAPVSAADGTSLYGWPRNPTPNTKVNYGGPAALGYTYIYSTSLNSWVPLYTPKEDHLITDGTNTYHVLASGDWYTQQEAFAGLPWYRFASRPGTSQSALERGATNDEMNIIIYDETGNFTGTKGNTLELYFGVSKLVGATTQEGDKNYYIDVINNRSQYLYANQTLQGLQVVDTPADPSPLSSLSAVGTRIADGVRCEFIEVKSYRLENGVDNYNISLGEMQDGYNMFVTENVPELDYILQGPSLGDLDAAVAKANFIISLCEERKDCMGFLSPPRYAAVNSPTSDRTTDAIVEWANELSSSSYVVLDSGYKYTYDRFNDDYRYIPLNGDIAGLMVNASLVAEPWYSPAGLSRGQIRNVIKLPYNPSKKQRDELYTARVNPVVTFAGEGTILFGDKTALGYSSAFDRINVRKLFLVIEKEIAKISRTTLFEFNDDITRSLFKNNVNPFLRDVQAKRGMYDFLVVCDSTNNVPEVIDRNEFIADIYIKPTKSINFITLNFIATKTGVTFDESVALFRGGSNA